MILLMALLMLAPLPAFAYLDAGTMSMIVHVVVGGLVGVLYAIRVFWSNVKEFSSRLFGLKKNEKTGEGNS